MAKRNGFKYVPGTGLELYADGQKVVTFSVVEGQPTMALASGAFLDTALAGMELPQELTIGGIDYTFPADNGDPGEQLQTNGSGVLTWETSGV